jgi:hypothetical protein
LVADFPDDIDYHIFEVEKVYLITSDDEDEETYSFIRKRTNLDAQSRKLGSVYQLTTVTRSPSGNTIEEKRIITSREYSSAFLTRDARRHIVHQQRISFLYKLQSFTIHVSTSCCFVTCLQFYVALSPVCLWSSHNLYHYCIPYHLA